MKNRRELFIGMMSGTSLDAVDAVLVDFSTPPYNELQLGVHILADYSLPIPLELKEVLLSLHQSGYDELHRAQQASLALAKLYTETIQSLLAQCPTLSPEDISAAGIHGQTIRHAPHLGYTLQLNAPAWIAEHTGISIVSDFRSRDIAAKGEGAPLVPAFHAALFGCPPIHPTVILNLGGIANISVLQENHIMGWDCGPANMLLDACCMLHTQQPFDKNGGWAASGQLIPSLLDSMLTDPFFHRPPPKSTGRDTFNMEWLNKHLEKTHQASPRDTQTTLTHLTAFSIARDIAALNPHTIWVAGGGAYNAYLLNTLRQYLTQANCHAPVRSIAEIGIDCSHLEALAFAWLAQQHIHHKPSNLPSVTGAKGYRLLGCLTPA